MNINWTCRQQWAGPSMTPSVSASQHSNRVKGFVLRMDKLVASLERISTGQVADTCS